MPNCGAISASIINDCDNLIVGGTKQDLYLINIEDIESYDYNNSNPRIIEAINLVTSPAAAAYKFEGLKASNRPLTELVKGPYQSFWNHQIEFRIFTNTPEAKEQIEALKNGRVVAILENNFRGSTGNCAFELYGEKIGLELSVATQDKNDADSQGAWVLTLSSPDDNKEPNVQATIFDTDYATTKALVESLL